jgi:hypothetical protein
LSPETSTSQPSTLTPGPNQLSHRYPLEIQKSQVSWSLDMPLLWRGGKAII